MRVHVRRTQRVHEALEYYLPDGRGSWMIASDSGPFLAMMSCTFAPISLNAVSQSMGSKVPSSLRRKGCVTRSSEYAIWARPWPRPQMRPFEYGWTSLPLSVQSWPSTVVAISPHLLEQPLHSDGAVTVSRRFGRCRALGLP